MNRRVLLSTLALLPLRVEAKKRTRAGRTVVCDLVGGSWSGPIAETVAAFHAIVPSIHLATGSCPAQGVRVQVGTPPGAYAQDRLILTSTTDLDALDVRRFVCHELMHVLTGIGDNYDSRADSCVWGRLDAPGPFDAALLRQRYGRTH